MRNLLLRLPFLGTLLLLGVPGVMAEEAPLAGSAASEPARLQVRILALEHVLPSVAWDLLHESLDPLVGAADDERGIVVLRGAAPQVDAAARVLRALDRPPAEVEIDVALVQLERDRRADGDARWRGLSAAALEALLEATEVYREPTLRILGRRTGELRLRQELVVATDDGAEAALEIGLALSVRPQVHAASGDVTLEVALSVADLDRGADGAPHQERPGRERPAWSVVTRAFESSLRLPRGESLLVSGFLADDPRRTHLAGSLPGNAVAAGRQPALILTPRVVRPPSPPAEEIVAFCAGQSGTELCPDE